ncbi:MAG: zinc ribbon domain-containing protein [Candidatus Bathyarchaeia archaeon]
MDDSTRPPFRKPRTIIEYKASLEDAEVKHLTKRETRIMSKTCHRGGPVEGRGFRCPSCGLLYIRDLSACIKMAMP